MSDVESQQRQVVLQGGCTDDEIEVRNQLPSSAKRRAHLGESLRNLIGEADNRKRNEKGTQDCELGSGVLRAERTLVQLSDRYTTDREALRLQLRSGLARLAFSR